MNRKFEANRLNLNKIPKGFIDYLDNLGFACNDPLSGCILVFSSRLKPFFFLLWIFLLWKVGDKGWRKRSEGANCLMISGWIGGNGVWASQSARQRYKSGFMYVCMKPFLNCLQVGKSWMPETRLGCEHREYEVCLETSPLLDSIQTDVSEGIYRGCFCLRHPFYRRGTIHLCILELQAKTWKPQTSPSLSKIVSMCS